MRVQVLEVPLPEWKPVGFRRKRSSFEILNAGANFTAIEREAKHLGAHPDKVRVAVVANDADLTLAGHLRANARPKHPGVQLFIPDTTKHGDQEFNVDQYPNWEENLRALYLSLNAMRALDRWGVTDGGQYAGFKALPAAREAGPGSGVDPLDILIEVGGPRIGDMIRRKEHETHPTQFKRRVHRITHPDNGGSAEHFHAAQEALNQIGIS